MLAGSFCPQPRFSPREIFICVTVLRPSEEKNAAPPRRLLCFASRPTKRLMPKQNSVAFEPFACFMLPGRQWEPVWCGTTAAANNCTLSHYHKSALEGPKSKRVVTFLQMSTFGTIFERALVVSHSCCRANRVDHRG